MKKLFIVLCFVLCGCGRKNPAPYYWSAPVRNEPPRQEQPKQEQTKNIPEKEAPPRLIKNEKCEDLPAVQIFKVTNDFSLAHTCKTVGDGELSCRGHIVHIAREEGRLHYEGQQLKPNKGKCFSYNGTYRYTDTNGDKSFIPKAKIVDSMIKEPDLNSYLLERTKR